MFGSMEIQIQYLLLLQHFRESTGGIFDGFFLSVTWFGEVLIPVCIMAIIYWGINKKAGTFIFFTFGLTLYTNVFLKMTACIKRPWLLDSRVCPIETALPAADGYSFPSGHTAGAMALWGSIAYKWWNNRLIRYSMIAIILLVAFSRNYIGVHTPQDVIVSIAAGILIIFAGDRLLKWLDAKKNRDIVFYCLIMALIFLLYLYLHIKCSIQMTSYNPLEDCVNPLAMKHGSYSKIGFMTGIFTGWILEKRFVNFDVISGSVKNKIISILAGLIVLQIISALIYKTGLYIMPGHIVSALCAFITAFYIIFLFPFVFKKFVNH